MKVFKELLCYPFFVFASIGMILLTFAACVLLATGLIVMSFIFPRIVYDVVLDNFFCKGKKDGEDRK